jgi:Xaa-Pro aminopeptidase
MRHPALTPSLFRSHRDHLRALLPPRSIAILHANDVLPTNADGTLPLVPNSDLYYLSGIEQEESVLVLAPDAADEASREILFVRESSDLLRTWEGHKLSREEARELSGIRTVRWTSSLRDSLHSLLCASDAVYLNTNEHRRASCEVPSRDIRFIRDLRERYPLHDFRRLAPLLHRLRAEKSDAEVRIIREAASITAEAYRRVLRFVKPGVQEHEVEAEFAHEFIRRRARFAYPPIIASGANNCILHYIRNDQPCRAGELLLLDVAASFANYNADVTRTLPVSGRFTRRQRDVYRAVLRVLRASIANALPGKLHRDWQRDAQQLMTEELIGLKILTRAEVRRQDPAQPACRKYFNHGLGHLLGLDVHDVGDLDVPFTPGWVLTVEPGIYLPDEGFGIRLEEDILITGNGAEVLTTDIPIEPEDIEAAMPGTRRR